MLKAVLRCGIPICFTIGLFDMLLERTHNIPSKIALSK